MVQTWRFFVLGVGADIVPAKASKLDTVKRAAGSKQQVSVRRTLGDQEYARSKVYTSARDRSNGHQHGLRSCRWTTVNLSLELSAKLTFIIGGLQGVCKIVVQMSKLSTCKSVPAINQSAATMLGTLFGHLATGVTDEMSPCSCTCIATLSHDCACLCSAHAMAPSMETSC